MLFATVRRVSAVGEPQQLLQPVDLQVQDISCNVPDISAKLRFMMLNEVIDSIYRYPEINVF